MSRLRLPQGKAPRWGQVKLVASILVVTLAATSLVVFAYLSRGYPANRVDLNDSGVWVTNDAGGLFGRLNKSAGSLDAYVNPVGGAQAAYTLDIAQDAGTVLAWDKAGGKLSPLNVSTARLLDDSSVPMASTMIVDLRGGTVAALDPVSGKLWGARYASDATTPPDLSTLASTAKPLATLTPAAPGTTLPAGARALSMVVEASGTIHAADIGGTSVTIPVVSGRFDQAQTERGPRRESVELTTVGTHLVALDVVGGTVSVDGAAPAKRAEVVPGSRLQQAGPDAAEVLLATPKMLYGLSVTTPEAASRIVGDSPGGEPSAPVRLRDCAYAAWSGSPGLVVRGCGGEKATPLGVRNAGAVLSRPVLRVNRQQIVVNDLADGQVYDLDTLQRVDNWDKVKDAAGTSQVADQTTASQEKEKPKANPDTLGARPGRTTALWVLDNDTDKGGRILSVSSVTQPSNPNAKVTIAPDGQSLIYTLSAQGGDADFTYQLSNGLAEERGQVHVADRGLTENGAPLRKAGAADPTLAVASGGTLPIQVLDQWRDPDGDPVGLAAATAATGTTNLTSDGRIELTAAATPSATQTKVSYQVSDGRSAPVKQDLTVSVLGSGDLKSSPIVTQPDVGRGEVGRSILVSPLLNDVPGADPLNPRAVMKLGAPVAPKDGVAIETDLVSGQVSVVGSRPGTYFLDYAAAFGSAAVAKGSIRVDVQPAKEDARAPVTVPDKAVVRGTGSVLVDVLSNDSDPLGSVLTVQGAAADQPSELKVAVVNGRWLKLTPATGSFTVNPTFVTYRVSNGVTPAVDGVVSVTQLAATDPDQILTRPDYATVRTGDATTIRVLDNDAALSGATLTLLGNVPGAPAPGQLKVYNPGATASAAGDVGAAYISGDALRYVAPRGLLEPAKLVIEYIAQTESGDRATGQVEVTVSPEPSEKLTNQAPTPRPIEARAVSGETLTIPVDPSNADPDGDSTAMIGITSAPTLGRVLGFSPTGITYQAYPDAAAQGTDTFGYTVVDRFGATATSTIRVGVTPPAAPQVAVPAPVSITAAPGATVTLYPLSSASFGKTDPVRVLPLDRFNGQLPDGASLDEKTQAIHAVAGDSKARPVQFSYGLTGNAGESAPATVTVYAVDGYKNPPRLQDATVKPDGSGQATVDVLATAFDPDGDSAKLKVTKVGVPDATIAGGKVTVPVGKTVRAIPFEVTDESGATSAATIFVPTEGAGGPYLRAGATIRVEEGKSVTVKVADYVIDSTGKPVRLTLVDLIKAGPLGKVTAAAPSGTELTVTGAAGYIGPGAVVAEFTNGATLDDPLAIKRFVAIPVQVGPETPVIRCPSDQIPVVRGGRSVTRDITSMCSVWSPTKEMGDGLTFEGAWESPLSGVAIRNGRALTIDASSDATPGAAGVIAVTAAGTKATPSKLNVVVREAPLATMSPITLPEMKAGERRDVNLAAYFSSPLKDPKPHAISITKVGGMDAQATVEGMRASITPDVKSFGRMTFKVVLNDVTEKGPVDEKRRITGTIAFDVFTVPGTPGAPQPQSALMSRSATLSWAAPPSNGAPILDYEVAWSGGTRVCPSSPCTITELTNGTDYTFTVRARNKAGWSPMSAASVPTRPNAQPLAVVATQTAADDKSVTLTWGSAQGEGSAITDYIVAWNGQTRSVGAALTGTFPVPANGPKYTFTIVAKNNSTTGPPSTVAGYAAGTPSIDGAVTPAQAAPADSATTTVTITVSGANQNGPQPVAYTMLRDGVPLAACTNISSNVCIDQGVTNGKTYTYSAKVATTFLGVTRTSALKSAAPYTPYGVPAAVPPPTVTPTMISGQLKIDFTTSPSRGSVCKAEVLVNSAVRFTQSCPVDGGGAYSYLATGLVDGQMYSVAIRVSNERESRTSTPVNRAPIGPPVMTSYTPQGMQDTAITYVWTANDHGSPIDSYYVTWDGSANGTATLGGGTSGSYTVNGLPRDALVHFHITPHNAAGNGGTVTSDGRTNPPPPPPTVSLSFSSVSSPDCSQCKQIWATAANFAAPTRCYIKDSYNTGSSATGSPPPNGTYKWFTQSNGGAFTGNYWGIYPSSAWVMIACDNGAQSAKYYGSSPQ